MALRCGTRRIPSVLLRQPPLKCTCVHRTLLQHYRSNATQASSAAAPSLAAKARQRATSAGRHLTSRLRSNHKRASTRVPLSAAHFVHPAQPTGIDIARFGLLSVATLPFTVWIATFTYDYVYRISICRDALEDHDSELISSSKQNGNINSEQDSEKDSSSTGSLSLVGREKELTEVSSLLNQEPTQIIVVAGGNEAGKSRFVSELLGSNNSNINLASNRGVTYIQLAQLVDSVSSFTQVLVQAFDLRWLHLRHALVDVLPFAGSEILVMKERFSDRDLAQALTVVAEALKESAAAAAADKSGNRAKRPVIVVDGLGEGPRRWMSSPEGRAMAQRFLQWCVYITKERRLAHVVLTGNEQLVLSLTDQNRVTRGHVKVVGLGDLGSDDAAKIIRRELPDASDEEVRHITGVFGGFIHDLIGVSRDISYRLVHENNKSDDTGSTPRRELIEEFIKGRFQQQVEQVVAAFANAREDSSGTLEENLEDSDDEMDPYLDPLKSIYSEAQASQAGKDDDAEESEKWTQLELWKTLQRIVNSPNMAVPFSELRDDIFDGEKGPILGLLEEDVLGFQVDSASDGGWFWKVTPASPALGMAFAQIVENNDLKARFGEMQTAEERQEAKREIERERARLHLERKHLDLRKKSLLRTIELGRELDKDELARQRLARSFSDILYEEESLDLDDRIIRDRLQLLNSEDETPSESIDAVREAGRDSGVDEPTPLKRLLKAAVLDIVDAGMSPNNVDDQLAQLRRAFAVLDVTSDGKISAADVARVIKASTGKDVEMGAAEKLVSEWDLNDDRTLDYKEFLRMLMADEEKKKHD